MAQTRANAGKARFGAGLRVVLVNGAERPPPGTTTTEHAIFWRVFLFLQHNLTQWRLLLPYFLTRMAASLESLDMPQTPVADFSSAARGKHPATHFHPAVIHGVEPQNARFRQPSLKP